MKTIEFDQNNNQNNIFEKRRALSELSSYARALKEEKLLSPESAEDFHWWESAKVNDIILKIYQERTGCKVFKSFKQWKELGFNIKKGSKAFVIWSQKREGKKSKEQQEQQEQHTEQHTEEESAYKFFPLAYLFTESQVEHKDLKGGTNEI